VSPAGRVQGARHFVDRDTAPYEEVETLVPVVDRADASRKPALDGQKRRRRRRCALLCIVRCVTARHGERGHAGYCRVAVHVARRQVDAGPACPAQELDAQDRIAAALEEVVVDTDVGLAQHLLPDIDQRLLHSVLRRPERRRDRRAAGIGQAFAIDLAVRR
jgi:hypothetical protein